MLMEKRAFHPSKLHPVAELIREKIEEGKRRREEFEASQHQRTLIQGEQARIGPMPVENTSQI